MRFQKCVDCREYKYIKQDGQCPSCFDDDDFVVLNLQNHPDWDSLYDIPDVEPISDEDIEQ